MILKTKTTILVIIWASFLLDSRAWGPVTHLYLCSLVAEKSGNETMHTFLAGCNSPDSLKEEWPELHSLEFAAHLFGYAVQQHKQHGNHHNSTYSLDSTTDDLIEFALGFGCHIANDEVGHHTNGFLNPPAIDHVIEFNLDSMIFHEKTGGRFDNTTEYVMSEHAIDLILKAATPHTSTTSAKTKHRYLRKEVIKPKPIDRARIQSAINHFKLITSAELALIRIQPPILYKFELKRNSFCKNVSNYQEVVTNFNLSAEWAVSTCMLWRRTLWALIKRGDLDDAAPIMHRAVNELFRANNGTSCVL
jgi:hypothetical protein